VCSSDLAGTVAVVFSSPISIAAGTMYAIVLVADPARGISWLGQCGTDSYAPGRALVFDVLNHPAWMTVPAWALLADSSNCVLDYAFGTYVSPALATPTPAPTPTATPAPPATLSPSHPATLPPTATSGDRPSNSSDPTVVVLIVGLAAAAVLVTLRRSGFARR
jgi:hypothetical protein